MAEPRVGIVHAPDAAASLPEILSAARGLARPVLIFRRPVAARHPSLVAAARRVADVTVIDQLTPSAVRAMQLVGLTTFHDSEVDGVDAVLTELGLPGAGAIARPWDKLRQRHLLPTGIQALPVDSTRDLLRGVRYLGLPGVLKPRRASTGSGLAILTDLSDVELEVRARCGWSGLTYEQLIPHGEHPSGVPWLGDYVSVETISDGDGHDCVAVFDKQRLAIGRAGEGRLEVHETGDVLPSRLPDRIRRTVVDLTRRALDSLGVRWRVTHTEVKVTRDVMEVIEVNGRVGGEVARLLRLLDGPDLIRGALTVALGQTTDRPRHRRDGFVATIAVPFSRRTGVVRSEVSRHDLRAIPGVIAVDEVASPRLPIAASGRPACSLVIGATDPGELDRLMGRVLDAVGRLFAADGLDVDGWLPVTRRAIARGERPRHAA